MRRLFWLTPLAIFAAAPAGAAEVVNVYTDFNIAAPGLSNSGLITYAYYPTGNSTTVTAYDVTGPCIAGQATCANASGIDALGVSRANDANPNLMVGNVRFESGQLNLHPGPSGQQPLVIFTAPTSDSYRFVGAFEAHNAGQTYNLAYGDANRTTIALGGQLGDRTFDFNRAMNPGDQVVFLLDAFGSYNSDSTGFGLQVFDTSIAAVPEPAAWLTMIAGFGVVGGTLRRRRRGIRPSEAHA